MLITRSTTPSLLWPGIHALFGMEYEKFPLEYTKIFDVRKSTKAYEKLTELTGLGLAAVKPEGSAITYDAPGEGITNILTAVTYGLGFIISEEAIEDNEYQSPMEQNTSALSWSMRTTKEIVHANILNRAFNAAYVYGDGVSLVNAAHPTANGVSSNLLIAADISEAAVEDAMVQIMNSQNSRGLPIAIKPLRVITGPGNIFAATRIFQSDGRVGTANNDVNAIKVLGLVPEVVVNHYLDDPDAWFVQTNVPNGLISMQRRAVDLQKDSDFDTGNVKAKATERYSAGFGDFRALWGNQGV